MSTPMRKSTLNNTPQNQHPRKTRASTLVMMLLLMSGLIILGCIFTVIMTPSHDIDSNTPSTNSIVFANKKLSQKILEWIPKEIHTEEDKLPDFTPFWSPIDFDVSNPSDPTVTLCKLNFKLYYSSPHLYAMFRDFVSASNCMGSNKKKSLLSTLMKEIEDEKDTLNGRIIQPSGFIFHESRVGSTLVANTLASDAWSIVFSESSPTASALLHCTTCDENTNIKLFRDIVKLIGRSPYHKRLFFKFQSITSTRMDIALKAFPDTPWAFIYRQPVQTMMSHLDPLKGTSGAPCLRSKRNPPPEVLKYINTLHEKISNTPNEAWCAAHLNMLCNHAINAYNEFGLYELKIGEEKQRQRGMLVNYESLPGLVARVLLPMFNVEQSTRWLAKMIVESGQYSKGHGKTKTFTADSEDKDERATHNIQKYSELLLLPTFKIMIEKSLESINRASPIEYNTLINSVSEDSSDINSKNWKILNIFPDALPQFSRIIGTSDEEDNRRHSQFDIKKEFVPWIPFSNTHKSKPFERVNCPLIPNEGYPKPYSMVDITNNWPTDSTTIPSRHYDALCHFNYQNKTELQAAENYREAEVPFIAYNIPEVDKVVKKWNDVDYLQSKLGKKTYRTETSNNNHFMYWHGGAKSNLRGEDGKKWKAPTGLIQQTFEDWLETAVKGQNISLDDRKHEYFRVSSDMGNSWLFKELPFFQPEKNLMMVEPKEQRGIHCRFGMRNVIAEAHFDGSRNSVVMLGGLRRWILTHPNQCKNMHMLPKDHPSGRHSEIDWSKPDINKFPNFVKIMGNEVILQPGDYLYVPTYWIHYIVSLNVNFQCNTRSGRHSGFDNIIKKCGF